MLPTQEDARSLISQKLRARHISGTIPACYVGIIVTNVVYACTYCQDPSGERILVPEKELDSHIRSAEHQANEVRVGYCGAF